MHRAACAEQRARSRPSGCQVHGGGTPAPTRSGGATPPSNEPETTLKGVVNRTGFPTFCNAKRKGKDGGTRGGCPSGKLGAAACCEAEGVQPESQRWRP